MEQVENKTLGRMLIYPSLQNGTMDVNIYFLYFLEMFYVI